MEGMERYACFLGLLAILCGHVTFGFDIRRPPSITQGPPQHISFTSGQEVTLPCIASGTPEPEFEWYKDGGLIDKNIPGIVWDKGSLTIRETTPNNQGEWQCFASNMHGKSMSSLARLVMNSMAYYPPGQVVKTMRAHPGEALKLTCDSLKSVPVPMYSWSIVKDENDKSNGDLLQVTERIQIDDEGHLYFANVLQSDHLNGNLYTCNIYNPGLLMTVSGSHTKIEVSPGSPPERKPTLTYATYSPTVGLRSKSISFKCIFAGNPTPGVQWSKVGGSLPFGRHTISNAGTTLNLQNLEDEDAGEYRCVGTDNHVDQASSTIKLLVQSEPVFVSDTDRPINDNFTEGDTAEFKCHADAIPTADVTWYINGNEITVGKEGPRQKIINNGLKLVIENLCKDCTGEGEHTSDLMNVQCMARNEHNYTFADAYLNVLRRTVLTVMPQNQELEYGFEVLWPCAAISDDSTPVTILWEYEGYPIQYEPGHIEKTEDNSLKLITGNDDDKGASFEGMYTCIATNGYSTDTASASLSLPEGPIPSSAESFAILPLYYYVFVVYCNTAMC